MTKNLKKYSGKPQEKPSAPKEPYSPSKRLNLLTFLYFSGSI
jgi:hypothetical protein